MGDIPLIRELTFATWPQTYSSIISKEQIDYMLDMIYSPASLQKQMEEEVLKKAGKVKSDGWNNLFDK